MKTVDAEDPAPAAEAESTLPQETPVPSGIYVYVCGAVVSPGVYTLPEGSRLFEACEAAGGFLRGAARTEVNLAREVFDGEQVRIPFLYELQDPGNAGGLSSAFTEDGKLDLNSAAVADLCTLPGIGESKAGSILSYREEHGGFSSIDELMQVEGIKEGIFNKIKDKITVR